MSDIRAENFPLPEETSRIIQFGFEVYNNLGSGFLEIVYKDALEYEFRLNSISFAREKEYAVRYKNIIFKHSFFADFVVFGAVILEVKSKEAIANEDLARGINYLKCSGCKVGLILNFGRSKLEIKRFVF